MLILLNIGRIIPIVSYLYFPLSLKSGPKSNDIAAIDDADIRDTISDTNDNFQAEHELDNNYDEDNISFVNHSLSQQPLLNMTTFSNSMV